MTASAGRALNDLYRQFGDRVAFLSVYVREAHPGDRFPQRETFEEKLGHAAAYRERDDLPWPVAVDDLDATLHRALDPRPNAAYVVDEQGVVVYRALWSNQERVLRDPLRPVNAGRRPRRERRTTGPDDDGDGKDVRDPLPRRSRRSS
jgi:hypothetical protein